ncbi:hypothetical protein [Sphingobium yanoikuyae]|jgi:uncharacterized protein YmfQ (DUF2313 family)
MVNDLITLRQMPENAELAAKEPFPSATKQTIKQWEAMHGLAWQAHPDRLSQIAAMAPEMRELSESRHVLVHSFWPYGNSDNSKITVQRVRPKKNGFEFATFDLTISEMDALNERLVRLYHRAMALSMNLLIHRSRLTKANTASE